MKLRYWILIALGIPFYTTSLIAEPFSFVALGDTAYYGKPDQIKYDALIELINQTKPEFSIHIGDLWGGTVCTEERYRIARGVFDQYDHPVIYTPGDNEWTDCNRYSMGNFDNVERLKVLRKVFFADSYSLGAEPMALVRQSDISPYETYVENSRWMHGNVLFVTLHVPGSGYNLQIKHKTAIEEAYDRHIANVAWLRDSARIARDNDLPALVLAIHAEILDDETAEEWLPNEFVDLVHEIQLAADRFAKPVLLIHGDFHIFKIDRPFKVQGKYGNITRLQVFGSPEIRAVTVTVNTETPWVFGFEPLYLE